MSEEKNKEFRDEISAIIGRINNTYCLNYIYTVSDVLLKETIKNVFDKNNLYYDA